LSGAANSRFRYKGGEIAKLIGESRRRTSRVLKDLEGLSVADIAGETGKSESAVKADLHRARLKLRAMLADMVGRTTDE